MEVLAYLLAVYGAGDASGKFGRGQLMDAIARASWLYSVKRSRSVEVWEVYQDGSRKRRFLAGDEPTGPPDCYGHVDYPALAGKRGRHSALAEGN